MKTALDSVALREKIISTVSSNGGHLSPSLGAVEIAMALVDVFEPESDRIIWDVGHQAYAWKILTGGRENSFSTIRKYGGLSPFCNPMESPADAAVSGHAGTAISVALGMAVARDRNQTTENVVAVVGDGAIANGTSLEALNCAIQCNTKLIVVLNDNKMSISRSTGAFSRMLARLISGIRYNRVKAAAEKAGHALKLSFLSNAYHSVKSHVKSFFLGNLYFERFGFRYIGPVDGHDLKALRDSFTVAKEDKRSVIVHVVTQKGRGFGPAEKNPTAWHGVGPFSRCDAPLSEKSSAGQNTWSGAFGRILCDLAAKDDKIVALTAGMTDGTGLEKFARLYPDRFFDVGIAEGHMVAFAAGLAARGFKPVVAVYSTFLQRAVDHIMHDVAIAKAGVVFCVDRAGVVGADGFTHQGLYDIAMLRTLPNVSIAQPKDVASFERLLEGAIQGGRPFVIRYPRGTVEDDAGEVPAERPQGARFAIWALGDCYAKAKAVAARMGGELVYAEMIKPLDRALLARQRSAGLKIVSIENGAVCGGFGESIGADIKFGWPDEFIEHGTVAELEKKYHLDVDSIIDTIAESL